MPDLVSLLVFAFAALRVGDVGTRVIRMHELQERVHFLSMTLKNPTLP